MSRSMVSLKPTSEQISSSSSFGSLSLSIGLKGGGDPGDPRFSKGDKSLVASDAEGLEGASLYSVN